MPEVFQEDTPLNYAILEQPDDFAVAEHVQKPSPPAEEIAANKEKWGWTA